MATSLTTFLAQVDILITADNDIIASASRQAIVKAAVERYSNDRPREIVDEVTGDGGKYYGLSSSLSSWSDGFSRVIQIEYPAATVASDEAPSYLEPSDWNDDFWADASGTSTRYLYLPNHAPASTETMRIRYTAPYAWDDDSETETPGADFYAICNLAAGLVCQAIAAKFSQIGDSTISADATAHTTKATEYSNRAKEFIALYSEHMGLLSETGGARDTPSGEFVDLDTRPLWRSGRRYLFHNK